jgi:hypothetical protein
MPSVRWHTDADLEEGQACEMLSDLRSTLQALRVVTSVARAATLVGPFQAPAEFEAVAAQSVFLAFCQAVARIDASARAENDALRVRTEILVTKLSDPGKSAPIRT